MSMADLKKQERAQRRSYIVDEAERLFAARGYDGVAMSDIAAACGINKAMLYYYFKNKDSLFFAVILRGLQVMGGMFREAAGAERDGLGRLVAACRAFFRFCELHPGHYQIMCEARSRRFDMGQVEGAEDQMALAGEIVELLCGFIREGIRDGTVRGGLGPAETAAFVMMACEDIVRPGVEVQCVLDARHVSAERFRERSLDLLVHAIAGAGPRTKGGADRV